MCDTKLDLDDPEVAFNNVSDQRLYSMQTLFRRIAGWPMSNRALARFAFWFGSGFLKLEYYFPPVARVAHRLVEKTIFAHFCGGRSLSECRDTIASLAERGVGAILDYAAEGQKDEKGFDEATARVMETVEMRAATAQLPFAVFKVSAIARMQLLEKVALSDATLNVDDKEEWQRVVHRVGLLCSGAIRTGKKILIDAEHTWIQGAIDSLAASMMREHNTRDAVVFTTVQMYRTDRMDFLQRSAAAAKEEGYVLGIKLVRGAYMEIECDRAKRFHYPSPIHKTREATDAAYDEAVRFCVAHVKDIAVVLASHNEPSVKLITDLMAKFGLRRDHPHISFAQLYGMGDNITNALANAGFRVAKYIPFGPVHEAIPYLIRRAKENSSVEGHMARQRMLIELEVARRRRQTRTSRTQTKTA